MRTLEIRRHTHRNVPQPHLSQQGVDLARRAGEGLGHFDRVMTSTVPRAFETAIAIGCQPPDLHLAGEAACGYCEGVRLTFEGDTVVNLEMLRVDQPQ